MLARVTRFMFFFLPVAFVLGGSTYGVTYAALHHPTPDATVGWASMQQAPSSSERQIGSTVASFTLKLGERVYIPLPYGAILFTKERKLLSITAAKDQSSIQIAPQVTALALGVAYLGVVDSDTTLHTYVVTIHR